MSEYAWNRMGRIALGVALTLTAAVLWREYPTLEGPIGFACGPSRVGLMLWMAVVGRPRSRSRKSR